MSYWENRVFIYVCWLVELSLWFLVLLFPYLVFFVRKYVLVSIENVMIFWWIPWLILLMVYWSLAIVQSYPKASPLWMLKFYHSIWIFHVVGVRYGMIITSIIPWRLHPFWHSFSLSSWSRAWLFWNFSIKEVSIVVIAIRSIIDFPKPSYFLSTYFWKSKKRTSLL